MILLALAAGNEGRIERIAEAISAPSFSWADFVATASHHRVLAMTTSTLRSTELLTLLPLWVRTLLSDLKTQYFARALAQAAAGRAVLDALESKGIVALVRKGLPLVARAYRDWSVRRMSDIDLLVGKEDRAGVIETLVSLGFATRMSREEQIMLLAGGLNLPEYEKDPETPALPRIRVGLSLALLEPRSGLGLPVADLFARRTAVDCLGTALPTLDAIDFVIDVCAHFYKDATSRTAVELDDDLLLYKLRDVALLAATLDASARRELRSRVIDHGFERPVHHACWYADQVFPGTMPAEISDLGPADPAELHRFGQAGDLAYTWPDTDVVARLFDTGRWRMFTDVSRWTETVRPFNDEDLGD